MKKNIKRLAAFGFGILAAIAISQTTSTLGSSEEPPEQIQAPEILATSMIKAPEPLILEPIKLKGQPELTKEAYDLVIDNRATGIESTPETWILALEWCESNGDNTAINEIDLDGTPSYYAFQFKPSTFRYYAETYGIIEKGLPEQDLMNELADYKNTRATVWSMMQDPTVKWENQFPWCVTKYIGRPPKVISNDERYDFGE